MKAVGLDGKTYPWNITKYTGHSSCSKLHERARAILKNLFPYDIAYEEVVLPGIKTEITNKALIADFYIHSLRLMLEVQGEQHYKFVQFFHNNKLEFFRAKKLDQLKKQWCEINNITLIELPFNETDDEWIKRIRSR
jgi:hypothetical protein